MGLFRNDGLRKHPSLRRMPKNDEEWTSFIRALNEQEFIVTAQTFTPTWTGFGTAPTGTASYYNFSGFAIIFFPSALTATSNATTMAWSAGSVPTSIRPSSSTWVESSGFLDGGSAAFASAVLATDGSVDFFKIIDLSGSYALDNAWQNTSTKGIKSGVAFFYAL